MGSISIPPWKPLPDPTSSSKGSSSSTKKDSAQIKPQETGSDPAQVESTIAVAPKTSQAEATDSNLSKNKPSQTNVIEPDAQINKEKVEVAELDQTQKSSTSSEQERITSRIEELPNQSRTSQSAQLGVADRASLQNQDNTPDNSSEQLALNEKKGADADSKLLLPTENFPSKPVSYTHLTLPTIYSV